MTLLVIRSRCKWSHKPAGSTLPPPIRPGRLVPTHCTVSFITAFSASNTEQRWPVAQHYTQLHCMPWRFCQRDSSYVSTTYPRDTQLVALMEQTSIESMRRFSVASSPTLCLERLSIRLLSTFLGSVTQTMRSSTKIDYEPAFSAKAISSGSRKYTIGAADFYLRRTRCGYWVPAAEQLSCAQLLACFTLSEQWLQLVNRDSEKIQDDAEAYAAHV